MTLDANWGLSLILSKLEDILTIASLSSFGFPKIKSPLVFLARGLSVNSLADRAGTLSNLLAFLKNLSTDLKILLVTLVFPLSILDNTIILFLRSDLAKADTKPATPIALVGAIP